VTIIRPSTRIITPGSYGIQVFSPSAAAGNGLLANLIGYWPGDEANGNLIDAHSNSLDLTDFNTVTSNPGLVYPLARQYTRVTAEYHRRLSEALLQTGEIDFTFATWVYLDTKPAQSYILTKAGGGSWEYAIDYWATPDRFRFWGYVAPANNPNVLGNTLGSPSTGTWYLIIAWNDQNAATMNIQINNGGVDSAAKGGNTVVTTVQPFYIGGGPGLPVVDGRIGPTMFWKSAAGGGGVLTAAQRTTLWNSGNGLAYSAFN